MLAQAQCWQAAIFGAIFVALSGPGHLLPALEFQDIFEVILESRTWKMMEKVNIFFGESAQNIPKHLEQMRESLLKSVGRAVKGSLWPCSRVQIQKSKPSLAMQAGCTPNKEVHRPMV